MICPTLHTRTLTIPCLTRRVDERFPTCSRCIQGLALHEAICWINGDTITPIMIKGYPKKRTWGRASSCPECGAGVKEKYCGLVIFDCEHGAERREKIKQMKCEANAKMRRVQGIKAKAETWSKVLTEKVCSDCGLPKKIGYFFPIKKMKMEDLFFISLT